MLTVRQLKTFTVLGTRTGIVGEMIATRIISLTQGGERDPDRLCERALAACGFSRRARGNDLLHSVND